MTNQSAQSPDAVLTVEQQDAYVGQLYDHIMKKCLWQFHSRAWDRERQNEHIIGITSRLLCGQEVVPATPAERCYYADAYDLARAYRIRFAWLADLDAAQIQQLMSVLKDKLDFVLITGSLNAELTDTHY